MCDSAPRRRTASVTIVDVASAVPAAAVGPRTAVIGDPKHSAGDAARRALATSAASFRACLLGHAERRSTLPINACKLTRVLRRAITGEDCFTTLVACVSESRVRTADARSATQRARRPQ